MKSLEHNGIYIPHYNIVGLSVKYRGEFIPLTSLAEQLCIQFVRKFDLPYMQDETFVGNFLNDLISELAKTDVGKKMQWDEIDLADWDWTDIQEYIADLKANTEAMSKEDKKTARELGKKLREDLKEKYGYAVMDGNKVPLMNWASEPACIYMSKGKNPNRGKWKLPVTKSDITLNLSAGSPGQSWGDIVWKPDEMWIASWKSPLDSKMKYVWFSPSSNIRQDKERKKFSLASQLGNELNKLERYIEKELGSSDLERRKLSTAVYLIKSLALRVGDEKLAGEHGTVGCTTLRKENITIEDSRIHLSFVGKDYVRWERDLEVPEKVRRNLVEFIKKAGEDFIFKGLNSNKIAEFLREVIPGLSAKVFRTYIAGTVWDEYANKNLKMINNETSIPVRKYLFKLTNLEVAKKLNHKKALPKNYEERLAKKKLQFEMGKTKLDLIKEGDYKKVQAQERKVEKLACDFELLRDTTEWNLGTSLTSYIDPNKAMSFVEKAVLEVGDVYSKSLKEKYSWAIKEKGKEESEN